MKNLFLKIILPLVGIAGILGFITLVNPIQQQEAAWYVPYNQYYACQGTPITVHIDPQADSCSSSTTSYQSTMHVYATGSDLSAYTIHWGWTANFCTDGNASKCNNANPQFSSGVIVANSSVNVHSPMASKGQYTTQACGSYQTDFGFYVTRNSDRHIMCGISLNNLNNTNNNAAYCHTGNTCVAAKPSPTPTTHPSPTPTTHPSTTPSVTPTVTTTPTVTQPVTPTVTPTGTNSNNCGNNNQSGNNDNNNCNNNSSNSNSNSNSSSNSSSSSDNNANNSNSNTINITLNGGGQQQQQQQQQVLGASTQPSQLPSTGAESDIVFGLVGLIPLGWKLRKLV